MDERNKLVAYKVIAVMYIFTILAIQAIVIFRQFALGQDIHDFEDIAIVMVINSLFLITALLYFGAIPVQKLKIRTILVAYALIIVLGSLFVFLKYNVFQDPGLSFKQLLHKMLIVTAVSGLMVLFFLIFSLLGKRRAEKELE